MRYEKAKDLKDQDFKRLCGVKKKTFLLMCEVIKEVFSRESIHVRKHQPYATNVVSNRRRGSLAAFAEHRDEIAHVLTDITMPFMDGAATIRALRKLNPKVKIIAASGLTTNEQSSDLQNLGINDFLAKPYPAEKL